jgi:hypothetical protein
MYVTIGRKHPSMLAIAVGDGNGTCWTTLYDLCSYT